jgi:hypothetical protein
MATDGKPTVCIQQALLDRQGVNAWEPLPHEWEVARFLIE